MMRAIFAVTVALLVSLHATEVGARAPGASWGQLIQWNGHYPTDRIGPRETDLLQQPVVAITLKNLLPGDQRTLVLQTYRLADKVSLVAGYLLADVCMPHDCGAENATLVLDLKGGAWIALFTHSDHVVSTRWYGTGDYVDLPPAVLTAVLSVHRPAN